MVNGVDVIAIDGANDLLNLTAKVFAKQSFISLMPIKRRRKTDYLVYIATLETDYFTMYREMSMLNNN